MPTKDKFNNQLLLKNIKLALPGFVLLFFIELLATLLDLRFSGFGKVSFAIMIAMIIGPYIPKNIKNNSGLKIAERHLLPIAIILMGFNLKLSFFEILGLKSLGIIALTVLFSILFSIVLGKLLRVKSSLAILIGIGNGICGSSAIAASSPMLDSDQSDIGIALASTNLIGILGIFLLSSSLGASHESSYYLSMMVGGSLQAVGHVAAASSSIGLEIVELSMGIKMTRVSLLIPTLTLIAVLKSALHHNNSKSSTKILSSIPYYLYGFILFFIIGNLFHFPKICFDLLKYGSEILLILAMSAIGLKISIMKLIRRAPQAILLSFFILLGQLLILHTLLKLS